MFKDLPEGQTHYHGDDCNPPHKCPICNQQHKPNLAHTLNGEPVEGELRDRIDKEWDKCGALIQTGLQGDIRCANDKPCPLHDYSLRDEIHSIMYYTLDDFISEEEQERVANAIMNLIRIEKNKLLKELLEKIEKMMIPIGGGLHHSGLGHCEWQQNKTIIDITILINQMIK